MILGQIVVWEGSIPIMAMMIPIIAIMGGITAGIVRTLGRQRLQELARRERIALIERGVDPAQLPALPEYSDELRSPRSFGRGATYGLMVGGLVTLAAGIGLMTMLYLLSPMEEAWAVGVIPIAIGIALLISFWAIPRNGNNKGAIAPPQPRT